MFFVFVFFPCCLVSLADSLGTRNALNAICNHRNVREIERECEFWFPTWGNWFLYIDMQNIPNLSITSCERCFQFTFLYHHVVLWFVPDIVICSRSKFHSSSSLSWILLSWVFKYDRCFFFLAQAVSLLHYFAEIELVCRNCFTVNSAVNF